MILYSIRLETLSQWRDFRIGVMCGILEPGCFLETIYLIFWKTVVQRVAVVKLGGYDRGGNCFGSVKVKVGTDTAKSTDVMIAGFRKCRDLIWEWEMFVKYETKVASRFNSVYWNQRVVNLCQLRLSPIRRNSVLEEFSDKRLEVIQVICVRAFWRWVMLAWKSEGWKARKSCVSLA